jgi:two-component system chemotaxis response regulator CheY
VNGAPEIAGMVVDVHMPRRGGIEMIASWTEGTRLTVPAFVLTAESGSPYLDRARALGVSGWFVKPFRGDELVEAMRAAMRA